MELLVMVANGFVGFHGWRKRRIASYTPLVCHFLISLFPSFVDRWQLSGINYESSFEAAVLSQTEYCQIWGYDFSVKSFGPEIPEDQIQRTHFHAFGLSGSDAHGSDDAIPMYTLQTLLNMNGTSFYILHSSWRWHVLLQNTTILTSWKSILKAGNLRRSRVFWNLTLKLVVPCHLLNFSWKSICGENLLTNSWAGGRCLKPLAYVHSGQRCVSTKIFFAVI